jgi:hypothetical protein
MAAKIFANRCSGSAVVVASTRARRTAAATVVVGVDGVVEAVAVAAAPAAPAVSRRIALESAVDGAAAATATARAVPVPGDPVAGCCTASCVLAEPVSDAVAGAPSLT